MHRVDADGYIDVAGERRFVDRALPMYEGTVDGAYWNNAIQEEICTVIENAGLTLRASGAADESAGWDQLYEAIFQSQHISNDALAADLSLSKFSTGTLSVNNATLSTVTDAYLNLISSSVNRTVRVSGSGIRFSGTGVPGEERTVALVQYNVRGWMLGAVAGNVYTSIDDGHQHTIGKAYVNLTGFATDIPVTSNVVGATMSYVETTSGNLIDNVPVKIESEDDGGGNRAITNIIISKEYGANDPNLSEIVWLNVFVDF